MALTSFSLFLPAAGNMEMGEDALLNDDNRDIVMEANDLSTNIKSWRDESERQLSIIIDSHINIIKAMAEEVSEMKSQCSRLSAIVKERDDLQETVTNLKGYIEHLTAKVPLPEHLGYQQNIGEEDGTGSVQVGNQSIDEGCFDTQTNMFVDSMIMPVKPVRDQSQLPISIVDNITGFICNDCDFECASSEVLEIHIKSSHITPEQGTPAPIQGPPARFKCEECDWSSLFENSLKKHVAAKKAEIIIPLNVRSALIQQCISNILKDISKITMIRIGRNILVKNVDMLPLKAPS